jgi:hypothetical protein
VSENSTRQGGQMRAGGHAAGRVVTADQQERLESLLGTLTLGDDIATWATVRDENGEVRVTINAATGRRPFDTGEKFTVSASLDVEASAELRNALRKLVDQSRDELEGRLKMSVAHTIVAGMAAPPATNGANGHD